MLERLNAKRFNVAGFRNAKIENVDSIIEGVREVLGELDFQLFDADKIAGRRHLYLAALNALAAFKGKYMISRSLGVEATLYASCQRQISRAFEMVGLNPKTSRIAILIFYGDEDFEAILNRVKKVIPGVRDDKILEEWTSRIGELKKIYSVSEVEFKAAQQALGENEAEAFLRLLWERMALLG